MTLAHDQAVVARLDAGELAGIVYWDRLIPKATTKYLRVRTNTGLISASRLSGPLGARTKTYWLTGVGTTPAQAAFLLEQATNRLLNWTPTVTGWNCRRLRPASSQPADMDPDIDGRYFCVDTWDLYSEPTQV